MDAAALAIDLLLALHPSWTRIGTRGLSDPGIVSPSRMTRTPHPNPAMRIMEDPNFGLAHFPPPIQCAAECTAGRFGGKKT